MYPNIKEIKILHTDEEVNKYLDSGWKILRIFDRYFVLGLGEIICKRCNATMDSDDNFCGKCGNSLKSSGSHIIQ